MDGLFAGPTVAARRGSPAGKEVSCRDVRASAERRGRPCGGRAGCPAGKKVRPFRAGKSRRARLGNQPRRGVLTGTLFGSRRSSPQGLRVGWESGPGMGLEPNASRRWPVRNEAPRMMPDSRRTRKESAAWSVAPEAYRAASRSPERRLLFPCPARHGWPGASGARMRLCPFHGCPPLVVIKSAQ